MATKLTKVVEDKKKSEAVPLGVRAGARATETEELLAESRNKVSELAEQNRLLKQRLIVAQQQLQAAQQLKKSSTMYESVSSRIDTINLSIEFDFIQIQIFRANPNVYHLLYIIIFVLLVHVVLLDYRERLLESMVD